MNPAIEQPDEARCLNLRRSLLALASGLQNAAARRKKKVLDEIMIHVRPGDLKTITQADSIASKSVGVFEANQIAKRLREMDSNLLATDEGWTQATTFMEEARSVYSDLSTPT